MGNKKIKFSIISLFGLLLIGLITYSTIHYTYHPLPTDSQYRESLVSSVFDDYFNENKEVIIAKTPTFWWEVIGNESNFMKEFYNDLSIKAKYTFSDVKIEYFNEPVLNENNVSVNFELNVKNLNKTWTYNGLINFIVKL